MKVIPSPPVGAAAPVSVDVVINNYNYSPYLRVAIDSALAQTHPATRVIVVDDGSTDESEQIIRSYGDRIEAVFKPNGGQASAMNAGLERVRGEVVVFLDSDDALEPGAAERIALEFREQPGLARVHYRLRVMDAQGRETGEIKPPARLRLAQGDLTRATLLTPFDAAWLPTSGNAFSSTSLGQIAPIPEEDFRLGADWYLVHTSSLVGPVGAIDEPLARYRVHGENGYARAAGLLDLAQISATVGFAERTRIHLSRMARRLGIDHDARRTASMCDIANRAVLLRVGPRVEGRRDSRWGLLRRGLTASRGRRDVGIVMKTMFLVWLTATLTAPRAIARRLGELFLLPERRRGINSLLGALHRR